jgi:hypothetical protein
MTSSDFLEMPTHRKGAERRRGFAEVLQKRFSSLRCLRALGASAVGVFLSCEIVKLSLDKP